MENELATGRCNEISDHWEFLSPKDGHTLELTEFRELRLGCDQVLAAEEEAGVFPLPQSLL